MIPRRPSFARAATLLALPAVVLFTGSCAEKPPARYPHVVMISLDTFRADHLGCYGNETVKTPSIDALARESTLFTAATTVVPTTLASHTSIMTGLYPRRHGVVRNAFMVNPENVMLAEVLQEEGFHTAGFLGSWALDRTFDFNQGFAHFDAEFNIEFAPDGSADQYQRRAEAVTDATLAHLDELGDLDDERLFLFVHYFDTHAPYDPPPEYGELYVREGGPQTVDMVDVERREKAFQVPLTGQFRTPFKYPLVRELLDGSTGEPLPVDADFAALYAGEVTYLDFHVGRLLDGLRERRILDDAIVILLGDHGETFWEHADIWHHGAWVYETNNHVPLLVRMPDGRGAGKEISEPVATIDIFPTLLELLEIPLPEPVAGISLAGSLDGETLPTRPIFSEATQPVLVEQGLVWKNQRKTKGVRLGRWKYIFAPYLSGFEELYDLETDPGEQVNLIADPPADALPQLSMMKRELNRWMSVRKPRPSGFNREQQDEIKAIMDALGYTGREREPEHSPGGGK